MPVTLIGGVQGKVHNFGALTKDQSCHFVSYIDSPGKWDQVHHAANVAGYKLHDGTNCRDLGYTEKAAIHKNPSDLWYNKYPIGTNTYLNVHLMKKPVAALLI